MLNYGMSVISLAERIGESVEDAQKIIDEFYKGFNGVKEYTDLSQKMLKEKGYVTDIFGRRRHISDARLPEFEVKPNEKYSNNYEFNPLIGAVKHEDKATLKKIKDYEDKLSKAKWKKEIDAISLQAQKEGFVVKNNRGFINRALRQCLNARIQGSSASMTKKAMIMIDNDEELNKLGFHLLVTVHDEVFGEAPTENSEQVAKRLSEVMIEAAKIKCGNVAWKCDPYTVKRWYEDEATAEVRTEYNKLLDKLSSEEALIKIKSKFSMIQDKYLEQICNGTYEINKHEDI